MECEKNPTAKITGPCVILAGAGTGKTYTIVEKAKYLIKNKIYSPERIVCLTFSNEAASSLANRIRISLDEEKEPLVRTFHGFSADLLRRYGGKIGIKEDFKILDPDQAKIVLHKNFRVQPYYCHKYILTIGSAKDLGISIKDIENNIEQKTKILNNLDIEKRLEELQFELQTLHLKKDKEMKKEILLEIMKLSDIVNLKKFLNSWRAYEKIKEKNNYQDYSDLNRNALNLLIQSPEVANDFDYIIIDEFQDTNKVQLDLIINLSKKKNITIVGDMNQSIYRFRGAYKDNFKLFKEIFSVKEGDIFNLDKSRRSSDKILRTAHKLILNNYEKKEECFEVKNHEEREGQSIEVYELKNAKEEARKVTELIEREINEGKNFEDICIMFRTHQQGRTIKMALESKKIPYISVTKNHLLKNSLIKIVIDYLIILDKLKRNKSGGEQAWWDLIYQTGFLEEDLIKIGRFLKDNQKNENLCKLILESLTNLDLSEKSNRLGKGLIEKIKKISSIESDNVLEILKEIYSTIDITEENNTEKDKENLRNLSKFYEIAESHTSIYYPDLNSFLSYLEAVESLGIEIPSAEITENGVNLMTSHSTKGLEYKTVIITNMAEKRFPVEKFGNNSLLPVELLPELKNINQFEAEILNDAYIEYERKHQLMEERRLCYVAFTRARDKLILTYANDYGQKRHYPSKFLNEIEYKENSDILFQQDLEEKYCFDKKEIIIKNSPNENSLTRRVFSPSALLLFSECQKQYEYKYVYNMPERKTISWEAIRLGSFVHLILETGVKSNFNNLKEFLDRAKEDIIKEEWEGVNLEEATRLIRVFFERNKSKYNNKSLTEQELKFKMDGFEFRGFADRIDFSDKGIEIIDYKTGKQPIAPKHRDWQLGYYALAAQKLGKVHKVTLDMLRQEMPLEFEIDEEGNARSPNFPRTLFNIYDIQKELVKTASDIMHAQKTVFKPCPIEKNCEFCNEYVYKL